MVVNGEFELIDRIRSIQERMSGELPEGTLGIGDDCAIIPQSEGKETLVSTDLLIEGQHFLFGDIHPWQLGWKSAAVNLSDIAAMGGKPVACFLSFALSEKVDSGWTDKFLSGFLALCSHYNCPLLGGDTSFSKGDIAISVTVMGECPKGQALKRDTAREGDLVCVSGNLGDSGAGLRIILDGLERDEDAEHLIIRHYVPAPRVEYGMRLGETPGVHALMDISDGIASDLRHILSASGLSAEIDVDALPLSEPLRRVCGKYAWDALDFATGGGEDYELLFTMAPDTRLDMPYHVIGHIVGGESGEIKWRGSDKDFMGFRHF